MCYLFNPNFSNLFTVPNTSTCCPLYLGNVNVNLLPTPCVLSTSILPPISFTNPNVTCSPNPVPPGRTISDSK